MTPDVYLNGEFVPAPDARVGVFDGGWLHGAGLFETMRAENGRVFRLESHVARLCRSAEMLMRPIGREELPSRVDFLELLERNELKVARLRMTVTAGSMQRGEETESQPLTVCATAMPLTPPPAQLYQTGVQVVITEYRVSPSDPTAGHKTTSYLPRLLGLREAQRARCMEALWFTTGKQLAEGSITNVFVVQEGVLKTPPVDTPVLPGIARSVVLELARKMDIEARECPVSIDDLLDADEVMLTSVIMQIMPVIRVEKHDIGDGKSGPMARKLGEAFQTTVRKECGHE